MAEREVTWEWGGGFARLGDSDYQVWREARVVGRGTKGTPDLEARFEVRDGVPECVEFTLRAQDGGRSVRSSDLRLFNLEGFVFNTFMREAWVKSADSSGPGSKVQDERTWWRAAGEFTQAQNRRSSASDAELQEVARLYLENIDRKPTKAVEEGLDYSPRTAARRVRQARDAGLLPETTKGKKKGWESPEGDDSR